MTNDARHTDPAGKSRSPYQFTIRTFFAAAVWISLLFAAIEMLEDWLEGTAILLLAWIAFGELYRRFRAAGPLLALGGGPLLLLVIWCIWLIPSQYAVDGSEPLPPSTGFAVYALLWGIVLSLLVAVGRKIESWLTSWAGRHAERNLQTQTISSQLLGISQPARFAAILASIHTVLSVGALLTVGASFALFGRNAIPEAIVLVVAFLLDMPILPLFILIFGDFGSPDHIFGIGIMSVFLGAVLYAGVGYLIARIMDRARSKDEPPDQ